MGVADIRRVITAKDVVPDVAATQNTGFDRTCLKLIFPESDAVCVVVPRDGRNARRLIDAKSITISNTYEPAYSAAPPKRSIFLPYAATAGPRMAAKIPHIRIQECTRPFCAGGAPSAAVNLT